MREIADSESEGAFSSSPPPESPAKPPENGFLLPAIPDPPPIEARRRDEQLPSELEGMVEIPTQKDGQLSEAHEDLTKEEKSDSQNDGKVPDSGGRFFGRVFHLFHRESP
jgi:hypothetical protein